MRPRDASLWRHADFLKLLAGETVSLVGSQVTTLALPLAAALTLHAPVFQVGLLNAAGIVPGLLLGPVAGVWADRYRRRPILIAVAIGRAATLGSIPIAAALGALTLAQLFMVAALAGAIGAGSTAWRPYLSTLVGTEQLVESNSMLEVSRATAQISGPGLGGVLVQALGAPIAIGIDALSFAVSAFSLGMIRAQEPSPVRTAQQRQMRAEIVEGVRAILGNPYLRTVVGTTGVAVFFHSIVFAVYVYYMARDLALAPAAQGAIFAAGGIGSLAGAFIAAHITHRFGVGPTIVGAELAVGLSALLIPLSAIVPVAAPAILGAAQLAQGISVVIYDINWLSLLQALTPNHLQGRVNASTGVLIFALQPLGAVLGGALGTLIGRPLTLLAAGIGWSLIFLWPLCSPIRGLRTMPCVLEDTTTTDSAEDPTNA